MKTRRQFMGAMGAVGCAALAFNKSSQSAEMGGYIARSNRNHNGLRIRTLVRRDETIVRSGAFGGIAEFTWAGDGRLLAVVNETIGWLGLPSSLHSQNALVEIVGGPQDATFQAVAGYPVLSMHDWYRPGGDPPWYASGMISVDQHVYVYLSTVAGTIHWGLPNKASGNDPFVMPPIKCMKIIHSADYGRTWQNQDGTQPVRFEQPKDQTRGSMLFWNEPRGIFDFCNLRLLQTGAGSSGGKDPYVYGYSMTHEGEPHLVMFRVLKEFVLERNKYEFLSSMRRDGSVLWTTEIYGCAPIHTFKPGWSPGSIVYNAPLGIYMMIGAWSGIVDILIDKVEASKLGLWVAREPWGPWEQVYEEVPWNPGGAHAPFIATPQIPSKWIADDGLSFWMTWTDFTRTGEVPYEYAELWNAPSDAIYSDMAIENFRAHANFRVNRQRVDVVL